MGGSFEVIAHGVPPGLGSYVQWDRKLDGRLAQALMSIPAIKAVGIGRGPAVAVAARLAHSRRDPAARRRPRRPASTSTRPTNNAGGLEGGVTNGEDLRVTGYMKPIATLMKPLRSVDLTTMAESPAAIERSDVCAVPAAAVVARSDGRHRPGRRAAREIRRRFDRGAASRTGRRSGSARPPASPRRSRHRTQNTQSTQRCRIATLRTCSQRLREIVADRGCHGNCRVSATVLNDLNALTQTIIGAAIEVHRELGPGMLESAYEACLAFELLERGLTIERQKALPLIYKAQLLDCGYRSIFWSRTLSSSKSSPLNDSSAFIGPAAVISATLRMQSRTADQLQRRNGLREDGIKRIVNGFPE